MSPHQIHCFSVHVNLNNIFGSFSDQIEVIKYLSQIDNVRKQLIEYILPKGLFARTPVNIYFALATVDYKKNTVAVEEKQIA